MLHYSNGLSAVQSSLQCYPCTTSTIMAYQQYSPVYNAIPAQQIITYRSFNTAMAYKQYSLVYNAIPTQQTATLPPFAVSPFMNSFAFSMFSMVASAMTEGASVVASSSPLYFHPAVNIFRLLLLRTASITLLSHT